MEHSVRIALCVKSAADTERAYTLLRAWAQEMCVRIQIKSIGCPIEALKNRYQIILTDGSSLDEQTRLYLRERGADCALVLVTGDERLAIQLYTCHPNALVAQPMCYSDLKQAMQVCFRYWHRAAHSLYALVQRRQIYVLQYRIEYIEAAGRGATLYCTDGVYRVNRSLMELEHELPNPPFLRIQKSFIVHLGAVSQITRGEVILKQQQSIPVARGLLRQVQEQFAHYDELRSEKGQLQ